MLILGCDRELARWAGDRLGIASFGPCVTIGVARKGEIAAVAVYNNYRAPNIEITFVSASPRWATRDAISFIFGYAFHQLRVKRITAVTEAGNAAARRFLERLGFREEGYHPDTFACGDGVSYGLLAKDARRWLREISDADEIDQGCGTLSVPGRSVGHAAATPQGGWPAGAGPG